MCAEKKQEKDSRTRNWTFIVYPDSVPTDWRDRLDNNYIPWIESPLHDKDFNADGTHKKPHCHILLLFDGKKSYNQVLDISASINGTVPQRCANAKGLVRYMAHLDNPEKAQYDLQDIIGHCGADVSTYLKCTGTSRYALIREMLDYVAHNDIFEFKDLVYYAMNNRFNDWFPLLCDNSAYIINCVIKSCRYSKLDQNDYIPSVSVVKVDENGEFIDEEEVFL